MIRGIAYILIFFFALQSCTIYRNAITPIPLAVNRGKVQLEEGANYGKVFKNIMLSDSLYYGLKRNGDRVLLTDKQIKAGAHLKNKPLSETLSFVVPILVVPVGVILLINHFSYSFNLDNP